MAFTYPPRTWTDGELVTASMMNTHVRDQIAESWHKIARKTADQSVTSSNVLQSDTHLSFSVGANECWMLKWMIRFIGNGTGDAKFAYTMPAGLLAHTFFVMSDAADVLGLQTFSHSSTDDQPIIFSASAGASRMICWETFVLNGATPGTFGLRWAQNVSNGTPLTFFTNSTLFGMKVT
jgi:hypothetical protein